MKNPEEWTSFLKKNDWLPEKTQSLVGDASTRNYTRIYKSGTTAILMDSRVEKEKINSFIKVDSHLRKLGLSAPEIFYADIQKGFLLLEDFGDNSIYSMAQNNPNQNELTEMYFYALETLKIIQEGHIPINTKKYTSKRLINEATEFFSFWYNSLITNSNEIDIAKNSFSKALEPVMLEAWKIPSVFSLRDYHAGNLKWLSNRRSFKKIVVLDFQDAIEAPASYDLVSLTCDARIKLNKILTKKMTDKYLELNTHIDPLRFYASYAAVGVQRAFRIIGVFSKLAIIDNKPQYKKYIPLVWEHVFEHAKHSKLESLREWLLEFVPSSRNNLT